MILAAGHCTMVMGLKQQLSLGGLRNRSVYLVRVWWETVRIRWCPEYLKPLTPRRAQRPHSLICAKDGATEVL